MRYRSGLFVAVSVVVVALAALAVLPRGPGTIDVELARIERVDRLQSFVTASGEITAVRTANIGSSVMGRLEQLEVREGERVRQGQVLAVIDQVQAASSRDAAAALVRALQEDAAAAIDHVEVASADLATAEARVAEASRTLTRERDLHGGGLTSTASLDAAIAAAAAAEAQQRAAVAALRRAERGRDAAAQRVTQARADERRARDGLAKTRIEAPIDGTVTRLDVEEGEMVVMGVQNQPGTILMTISDLAEMEAEIRVAESDVLRLSLDDPASVTLEALPGSVFPGRVVEVGASAIPQEGQQATAREFKVVVRLDDPGRLRPGLTCDVEILVDERQDVLVAPLQAVVERLTPEGEPQLGVFVEDGGTAMFTPLERTGVIGGLTIEVEGVAEGARVVAGPIAVLRELADGVSIRSSEP